MCWQSPGFHLVLLLTVHVLQVILATLTASMSPGLKMTLETLVSGLQLSPSAGRAQRRSRLPEKPPSPQT